jgi:hypothetical protein
MITIAQFSKPEEAHLLRMRLEAGGVPAFVLDENMVQMDWLYSNAIGGVRLQIAEEDAERAREILEEEPAEELPSDRPVCPSCGSLETGIDETPRRITFLTILLCGVPLFFPRQRWKCAECQATWREGHAP